MNTLEKAIYGALVQKEAFDIETKETMSYLFGVMLDQVAELKNKINKQTGDRENLTEEDIREAYRLAQESVRNHTKEKANFRYIPKTIDYSKMSSADAVRKAALQSSQEYAQKNGGEVVHWIIDDSSSEGSTNFQNQAPIPPSTGGQRSLGRPDVVQAPKNIPPRVTDSNNSPSSLTQIERDLDQKFGKQNYSINNQSAQYIKSHLTIGMPLTITLQVNGLQYQVPVIIQTGEYILQTSDTIKDIEKQNGKVYITVK